MHSQTRSTGCCPSPHALHRTPRLASTPLHAFSNIVGLGTKHKPSVRRLLPCMHAHTPAVTSEASERTDGRTMRPAGGTNVGARHPPRGFLSTALEAKLALLLAFQHKT